MRSDVFNPSLELKADTSKANFESVHEFRYIAMVSRNTANFFFSVANDGRIRVNNLRDELLAEDDLKAPKSLASLP